MNSLRKTLVLAQVGRRWSCSGSSTVSPTLKLKQEMMQVPDGKPVHLKGGTVDLALYYSTLGLSVIALGMCFKVYYDLSVPKK